MTPDPSPTDALPPRLAWYAVWRWKRRWLVCLSLTLLAGYPLSMGPTIWLQRHGYLPAGAMIVYRPFIAVDGSCDPVVDALHWYATLWSSLP
jgi:hypothetical protein